MPNENTRNTIIFTICALAMLVAYQFLVIEPQQKAVQKEAQIAEAAAKANTPVGQTPPGGIAAISSLPVAQALAAAPRIAIDTPALKGSLSLQGGRFDNLELKEYRQTLDPTSPQIELLRPDGSEFAFFAQFGWTGQNIPGMPTRETLWTLTKGSTLTPATPIQLTYAAGNGLTFVRDISVDDQFMFTVTDTVANRGGAAVTVAPYASVQRTGLPPPAPRAHPGIDGAVGVLGEDGEYRLTMRRYTKWAKDGQFDVASTGGWLGIGDKYWLAALIPDQKQQIQTQFITAPLGEKNSIYEARYIGAARAVPAGTQITDTRHFFAGAKRNEVLLAYRDNMSIPRFDDAIDWSWGYFITKPIFWLIKFFQGIIGNFGLAILMMTVVVKAAFFYPANLSFASMTKMKKVQPQLEQLKLKHKDDAAGLQQAMMKLYRDEKINPLLGCLPMLATLPVFLALFHVLSVTIEMRHAPFYGWIHDLSDRDPTTIFNLFGLLPFVPANLPLVGFIFDSYLHLGVWPLLYGLTMWLTQAMSPSTGDPTQQMILRWMPVMFTFILAGFPAGLLIYYCWSNVLTILQQYIIMRRFKVDNPIDGLIRRVTGKPKPAT